MIRPLVADELVSEGVKSGDEREVGELGQGLMDTRLHFSGSLFCKGQGENVLGFKWGGVLEQMDNPLRDNTGLAASRARDDEQRPVAMFNCPKLFRVEQHVRNQESGYRIQGKPLADSLASLIGFSWSE
jgi:hypothetical protein